MEQDKIITTAKGGRYRMDNLVPACSGCNKHRSDKPFDEVIKKIKVGE
jgi:5-methylcytosine-specific restriction endonuclease McrA